MSQTLAEGSVSEVEAIKIQLAIKAMEMQTESIRGFTAFILMTRTGMSLGDNYQLSEALFESIGLATATTDKMNSLLEVTNGQGVYDVLTEAGPDVATSFLYVEINGEVVLNPLFVSIYPNLQNDIDNGVQPAIIVESVVTQLNDGVKLENGIQDGSLLNTISSQDDNIDDSMSHEVDG